MRHSLLLVSSALALSALRAADPAPTTEQLDFFEKKVRPVLVDKCYKCHSTEAGKAKGGLVLDDRAGLLKGGENGPSLVPGNPEKSSLITAITYKDKDLQMPPKGEKLADSEIAALTEWVKMGAPDPRKASGKLSGLTDKARQHWAFKPVVKPAPPTVKNRAWAITPVDQFVLAKIEEKGLLPSPGLGQAAANAADAASEKAILLRRATYDLTGLPPTPKDVDDFLNDKSPYAFAKVVDRLLSSPAYGERWARYWLDTARYADSTGDRNTETNKQYKYPHAWTYRDYVVRAVNDDKPYDRFILEQIAADQLPDIKDKRDLAAMGFLTVGQKLGNEKLNQDDIINDRIDVIGRGMLGITIACARCHDHMFDPISIKDYYALHGVFASSIEPKTEDLPAIAEVKKDAADKFNKEIAAIDDKNRQIFYDFVTEQNWNFRAQAAPYLVAAIKKRWMSSDADQAEAMKIIESEKLFGPMTIYIRTRIRLGGRVTWPLKRFIDMPVADWPAVAASIAENKNKAINPIVAKAFEAGYPKNFEDLAAAYEKIFKTVNSKAREYTKLCAEVKEKGGKVTGIDEDTAELLAFPLELDVAGNLNSVAIHERVLPWGVQIYNKVKWDFYKIQEAEMNNEGSAPRAMVLNDSPEPKNSSVFLRGQKQSKGETVPRRFLTVLSGDKPQPFKMGSGRLELAKAIADKNNPLTARVMVNRVWMHHFGEGFVRTPDDLGTQSEAPTHPELLDYLSAYFMEQGWSLKKLHKLIMLSKVYQISSYTRKEFEAIDPFNRLLWRANVRRLEFEAVRDSLLVFGGDLDSTLGGQPVNITDEPYSTRRSIYGYIDRGSVPELMGHFDFSDPTAPNSKRTTSIVPQQALFLMNSPMVIDAARNVIARPEVAKSRDGLNRVFNIYKIIFQRPPSQMEIQVATDFLGKEVKADPQAQTDVKEIIRRANQSLAQQDKKEESMTSRTKSIQATKNAGERVERKALNAWETYVQALLLSNEAAYVN